MVDGDNRLVCAYVDENEAKKHADSANEHVSEWNKKWNEEGRPYGEWRKFKSQHDPNGSMFSHYHIEEIELREKK